MNGLRQFDEYDAAAKKYSKQTGLDVMLTCNDGSEHLYANGEEKPIYWLPAAVPSRPAQGSMAEIDLTPARIQSGRWSDELERFIPSRTMGPEEFLILANDAS